MKRASVTVKRGSLIRETKDSSNSIEAIARNHLFSVWSPTERNDGVSPEKHPGSERWPPGVREPLSRFSKVGLGAVLFVRACRAIAHRMVIPSWPVWEPTSFSDRGLEHNLSNLSVRGWIPGTVSSNSPPLEGIIGCGGQSNDHSRRSDYQPVGFKGSSRWTRDNHCV